MNVGILGANPYPREKQRRTQLISPMTHIPDDSYPR